MLTKSDIALITQAIADSVETREPVPVKVSFNPNHHNFDAVCGEYTSVTYDNVDFFEYQYIPEGVAYYGSDGDGELFCLELSC